MLIIVGYEKENDAEGKAKRRKALLPRNGMNIDRCHNIKVVHKRPLKQRYAKTPGVEAWIVNTVTGPIDIGKAGILSPQQKSKVWDSRSGYNSSYALAYSMSTLELNVFL